MSYFLFSNFGSLRRLEENEGFCNYKEQLVFELHWTFAIGENLEVPNHFGQVI